MKIDIGRILEGKTGKKLPSWVVYLIERLIHQNTMNDFLARNSDKRGISLFKELLGDLNVSGKWINEDKLPQDGRCIFVCNHPLGAVDGVLLSCMLYDRYGDIRYVVNDMLYNIEPLREIFLPVNTTRGFQNKDVAANIQNVMQSDIPIASFPAGYCSRFIDGKIQDRLWKKSFISQAINNKRDIIPLFFDARNSLHFYAIEYIRQKLNIKFDLGTPLLPDEMYRAKNKKFEIIVGDRISYQSIIDKNIDNNTAAQYVRECCYNLRNKK